MLFIGYFLLFEKLIFCIIIGFEKKFFVCYGMNMRNIPIKKIVEICLAAFLVWGFSAAALAQTSLEGEVSWYGPGFHSKITASGEEYDMYGLTAAHRTWAFGTLVQVVNSGNGRKCIVRVNDRGPVAKSLLMDLSYGGAMAVSSRSLGKAKVRLSVVGDKNGPFDKECAFYLYLDDKIILPQEINLDKLPEFNEEYYKNIAGGVEMYRLTQKHIKRLLLAKIENAPSLLVSINGSVCLGPYKTFKDAEAAYHKVATQYPHASVWLEKKMSAKGLVSK